MVEEVIAWARGEIERADNELKKAEVLVERLRRAGEPTAEMEAKVREVRRKLEQYRKAFAE